MTKSKEASKTKVEATVPPKNPLAGFSKFGKPPQFNAQKFSPRSFSPRPTFVTQHKGGGGK